MKYEVCRLRHFWVIALQESVDGQTDRRMDRQTDGRTDRQTDGQTDRVITIGLPHLRWRGPNKSPIGANKCSRGITPTKVDQRGPKVELDLYHVDTHSSKYTWAPQVLHITPVMIILKGYFYIILFSTKRIKETNVKFQLQNKSAANRLSQKPLPWTCSGSDFLYAPWGHIVTGDLNIVRNDKTKDLLRKGPKHRGHVSFSWHQNFDIIMDACEAYARRLGRRKRMSNSTLFLSGLSRSVMCLNAESDDLNILSTPDTSPF